MVIQLSVTELLKKPVIQIDRIYKIELIDKSDGWRIIRLLEYDEEIMTFNLNPELEMATVFYESLFNVMYMYIGHTVYWI